MAENSEISWCDHTFNPWMGCTKVSPACAHCYAERDMDHRYGKVAWGANGTRVLTSTANWAKPLQWNRKQSEHLHLLNDDQSGRSEPVAFGSHDIYRPRVFCASLADVFEDWEGPILDSKGRELDECTGCGKLVPRELTPCCKSAPYPLTMNDVRKRLFALIDATPHLDWLLLTKRPENVPLMWPIHPSGRYQEGMSFSEAYRRDNVWLGTSVENQEFADKRIPELLQCRDLSPVLFLSCEPLLGLVDLDGPFNICGPANGQWDNPSDPAGWLDGGIDWVITGGESGPDARPADPDWFRSIRDQCEVAGVPFHFKQWGEFDADVNRVGKKQAGRLLDGQLHNAFPKVTK